MKRREAIIAKKYQSALSKMQQGESEKRRTAVVQQLLAQEVS